VGLIDILTTREEGDAYGDTCPQEEHV
jgi:hypothetical protein